MVMITKDEKENILKAFPKLHITRTMKQDSKRHHYYCEEQPRAMRWLEDYRKRSVVENHAHNKKPTRRKRGR